MSSRKRGDIRPLFFYPRRYTFVRAWFIGHNSDAATNGGYTPLPRFDSSFLRANTQGVREKELEGLYGGPFDTKFRRRVSQVQ